MRQNRNDADGGTVSGLSGNDCCPRLRRLLSWRGGLVMRHAKPATKGLDYFVIVKPCAPRRTRRTHWTWDVRCRSEPPRSEFVGGLYMTPQEARLAGVKALSEFLRSKRAAALVRTAALPPTL